SAILGQNPAGGPPEVGSSFADIRDGQQALIGDIAALKDNAGHCNLCMSKNYNISWATRNWLVCDFDTYITEAKNAECATFRMGKSVEPNLILNPPQNVAQSHGIKFLAPGVWLLNSLVTVSATTNNYQYYEHCIRVYETDPLGSAIRLYTETRPPGGVDEFQSLDGAQCTKSVVIPDDG